jgi:hypothetical protein
MLWIKLLAIRLTMQARPVRLNQISQLSGMVSESWLASSASFKRSALLM